MGSERLAIDAEPGQPGALDDDEIDRLRARASDDLAGSAARRGVELLADLAERTRGVDDEQFCRVVTELLDAVGDLGDLDRQQQVVALAVEATARAEGVTHATGALVKAMTARIATARGDREASERAVSEALAAIDGHEVDARSRVALSLSLHRATNGVGDRAQAERFVAMARDAARSAEDHRLELRVEVAAALDALDAGRRPGLMRALARIDDLRRFVTSPVALLAARSVENSLAVLEGRYDSAATGLADLDDLAEEAGVDSPVVWRQFAMLGLDTADLATFLPTILAQSDSFPQSATLHALAALTHLRAGDASAARRIVRGFAASDFGDLGAGGPAPVTGAILAQTVHELGDADLAEPLLVALAPFGDRCVVDVTGSAIWLGSLDHHRGLLASLAGRHEEAIRLLDRAAEVHEHMRSRPWSVRTALAGALARERAAGSRTRDETATDLRRWAAERCSELGMRQPPEPRSDATAERTLLWRTQSDHWEIGAPDGPIHVADRVGLWYLGRLLEAPGVEISATDLDRARHPSNGRGEAQSRVNVTKAIRSAIALVGEHDEELGAHLSTSIRTGARCRYEPGPLRVSWTVGLG